jgi:hypothetical protein
MRSVAMLVNSLNISAKEIRCRAQQCCLVFKIEPSQVVSTHFLDSDQMLSNQAHALSAQENRCERTLSSNADAGSHEAGRMMVRYLRHFLAGLCRLSSTLASRICKHLRKGSDFFFQDAVFSTASLLFRSWTPIRYAISWIWLAPKNAGHFVVDPICGPKNNEMRSE